MKISAKGLIKVGTLCLNSLKETLRKTSKELKNANSNIAKTNLKRMFKELTIEGLRCLSKSLRGSLKNITSNKDSSLIEKVTATLINFAASYFIDRFVLSLNKNNTQNIYLLQ